MKKRILSLVLAALLIVSVFLLGSCGETEIGTSQTSAAALTDANPDGSESVSAETALVYPGEITKYDGTFTLYARVASTYSAAYILGEDQGDIMEAAALKRNLKLENDMGVTIQMKEGSTPENDIDQDIKSGSLDYDAVLSRRKNMAGKAISGIYYDFNKMNLDFSNPWWDINCAKGYNFCGHLFFMANDISIARLSGVYFYYFNKQIVDSFKLPNPYDLVAKNEWTLDNFLEMVKGVSDVGADGNLGTYGLIYAPGASNGNHMHMLTGFDVKYTREDADGERKVVIGENIEKIQTAFEKMHTVFADPNYTLTYQQAADLLYLDTSSIYNNARAVFADGHFLFLQGSMGISSQFANMQDDYGAVPNPKYNSDQQNYSHMLDVYTIIFAVPNAAGALDMDRTAKILDYWAFVSHDTIIPSYYDITIKTKRVSDPIASQMIDVIRDTIDYEMANIYGLSIASCLDSGYTSGNVVSLWKNYEKSTNVELNSLIKKMQKLE